MSFVAITSLCPLPYLKKWLKIFLGGPMFNLRLALRHGLTALFHERTLCLKACGGGVKRAVIRHSSVTMIAPRAELPGLVSELMSNNFRGRLSAASACWAGVWSACFYHRLLTC